MRVLHIAPDYPNSKLYRQLISSLEGVNCQNKVYVQSMDAQLDQTFPVYYLNKDFGLADRLLFFRKQWIIRKDIIRKKIVDDIDIIHAHNLFSAGYNAMKLKRKYGLPYIVAVRNTDVNDFFHYMIHLRFLGVKIMKEADAVIFLSPAYRDYVINTYVPNKNKKDIFEKSCIIPNGLDPYFMNNRAESPRKLISRNKVRLVYAGDVDKNKNVRTTIKACRVLRSYGYEATLSVIGRIIDKTQENIKVIEFVKYHPFSPKEKVREFFNEADVFVMPSVTETFGLVYIEAMSQGLPVIYSLGQGFDGYFEEGKVGYHVPCYDENAIANSIVKIIENYSSISEYCIKAVEDFSWKKKANEYKELYKSIIFKTN